MGLNKFITKKGRVLLDLTGDTVTPETLGKGVTAHDRSGEPIVGTMEGGGGGGECSGKHIIEVDELPTTGEDGMYYAIKKCTGFVIKNGASSNSVQVIDTSGLYIIYKQTVADLQEFIPQTDQTDGMVGAYVAETGRMFVYGENGWEEDTETEYKVVFSISDAMAENGMYLVFSFILYEYKNGEYVTL